MTGQQAKQALERSTPYVTLSNLIALVALAATMLQAGILDVSAGDDPAPQAQVTELSAKVSDNASSIGELRRINDRQDAALTATQNRFGDRMDRVESKLDKIYQLLIGRSKSHEGPG